MIALDQPVELLAPAKNLLQGMAAIDHGADALYIGGPGFGARQRAGNSLEDIAQLCDYAHRYGARVFLALNTLLTDDQLEPARQLAWDAYAAGVDALIMQDMGLITLDLPPIEWHASTQCDIRSPEKARFLESVGFDQVVLAREMSLDEIAKTAQTLQHARIEHFVHGALCVSYSGQCYISEATHHRSANRGACAQLCRLPYDVYSDTGEQLAKGSHVLSLKDNAQLENLERLLDAGVRSLKIEGRLKDMSYVKNVTAAYRQALDGILARRPEFKKMSDGEVTFHFTPDPSKTFSREATDYFIDGKRFEDYDLVQTTTPKAQGVPVANVRHVEAGRVHVTLLPGQTLNQGDGLTYVDTTVNTLRGLRVNTLKTPPKGAKNIAIIETLEKRIPLGLQAGSILRRNVDVAWEKTLKGETATRSIGIDVSLYLDEHDGVTVMVTDGTHVGEASVSLDLSPAQDPRKNRDNVTQALSRVGGTEFHLDNLHLPDDLEVFLPVSIVNQLRRDALISLQAARVKSREVVRYLDDVPYPRTHLGFEGNVANQKAREFYQSKGVRITQPAFEIVPQQDAALMTCRHCIRLTLNRCPKQLRANPQWIKELGKEAFEPRRLTLVTPEGHVFWAHFYCQATPCEMTLTHEGQDKPALKPF